MKAYSKMYLYTIIGTLAVVIYGCNPKEIPLKGNYPTLPSEISSRKSVDSLWADINNLFMTNGFVIDKIDKQNGLVVTKTTSFTPIYSFENESGQLIEPQAWIVFEKVFMGGNQWHPNKISTQWSIQVTAIGNGDSKITVEPVVLCKYKGNWYTDVESSQTRSTGKLEELIKKLATQ